MHSQTSPSGQPLSGRRPSGRRRRGFLALAGLLVLGFCPLIQARAAESNRPPEIEFKVLLIIKQETASYHPLFLPIRARMTEADIRAVRRCFEVETPDMVRDLTGGKVRFSPTVLVSQKPLRVWNPGRLDSAEYFQPELLNELQTCVQPGQFDSVGYYFLHYEAASGYRIPRAGYGVGGYDAAHALGLFAVHCTPQMNARDEIFLHEWMHGLDGFYGGKPGVKLPAGMLHGTDKHGYGEAKAWRPQDTFTGYMRWYRDYLNGTIAEGNQQAGLGSAAWKHGPLRNAVAAVAQNYRLQPLPIKTYPAWVHDLMQGDLTHAVLGQSLFKDQLQPGDLAKTDWHLETWNTKAGTKAAVVPFGGSALQLDSSNPNDARLVRTLALQPSQNYVFTAEVKTERVEITEAGGRLAVNLYAGASTSTKDLSGSKDWTRVVLPFTTGPKETSCRVKLALGGYASLARGRAWFRNIQVRPVAYPLANP